VAQSGAAVAFADGGDLVFEITSTACGTMATTLPTVAGVALLLPLCAALQLNIPTRPCSRPSRAIFPRARDAISPRAQFGGFSNPFSEKAVLVKLQLAFREPDRQLVRQLNEIALRADFDSGEGIAKLCEDTTLLLLRRCNDATACGGRIVQLEEDKALREYDREAISEAAKFERDTTGVGSLVGELNDRTGQAAQQTVVIVTALGCVALDGASSEGDVGGNLPRLRGGLELLASAARRPGAVLAFEALWVPDEDDEVLDGEELTLTWPEIISC
jgi:uncharacterized membrane protein